MWSSSAEIDSRSAIGSNGQSKSLEGLLRSQNDIYTFPTVRMNCFLAFLGLECLK